MKILVGICGIGNGHLNRQTCVIEYLLECGHNVVVATTDGNLEYFSNKFPNLPIVKIDIPWITCNENGIDFKDCLERYNSNGVDQYKSFFEFAINVNENWEGTADLVITDYEPNVAQYAYAVNKPLICMEQQSKFLYLEEENTERFSITEEISRLSYFFPKFDKKIISSFFPIDIDDERVEIVSPIVKKFDRVFVENQILVYFSPYSGSYKYKLIMDAISQIKQVNFVVYTNQQFDEYNCDNVIIKPFGETFKNDLEKSVSLITTAGHQLLSEAISINRPAYVMPLDTYEQNYNALMIEKYGLGMIAKDFSKEEIEDFYKNINIYIENIKEFNKLNADKDWKKVLKRVLKKY